MATKGRSDLLTNIASGQVLHASQITDIVNGTLNLNDDANPSTIEDAVYKDLSTVNAGLAGIKLGRRKFGNSNGGAYSYWFEGTATSNEDSADTTTLVLDDGTTFPEIKTYEGNSPVVGQAFIYNSSGDTTGTFPVQLDATNIIANFGTGGLNIAIGDTLGLNLIVNLGVE